MYYDFSLSYSLHTTERPLFLRARYVMILNKLHKMRFTSIIYGLIHYNIYFVIMTFKILELKILEIYKGGI